VIDVPAKTECGNSNAVAGYYISSTGRVASGRVASTSDIVASPSGEPLPSQMPQQSCVRFHQFLAVRHSLDSSMSRAIDATNRDLRSAWRLTIVWRRHHLLLASFE
jgi:hypothetical protein